jgi:N-acetylglucosaminyldiphosphoundecaprenol N-acetyl-beta-D-mannosaminyltransferase
MTRRILCVQLADIGDLVLTTPALRLLREHLPDAHITLLTTPHAAPIIPDDLTDDIITFDKHTFDRVSALVRPANARKLVALGGALRGGDYDTVVYFHHFSTWFGVLKFVGIALASGAKTRVGLRSERTPFLNAGIDEAGFGAVSQVEYWTQLVAVVGPLSPSPQTPPPMGEELLKKSNLPLLPEGEGHPRIAIHAGSGGYATARRWEPAKFAAVAARLMEDHDAHIVFVGGPGDDTGAVIEQLPGTARITDLTGKTTLPQLAWLLERCDLFIGADSGVMQVAGAVGVPVVAIFGPSNSAAWQPIGGHNGIVTSAPRCAPCSYVGTGVGLRDGCAARTCMKLVTPEMVLHAAESYLVGTRNGVAAIHGLLRPVPPVPANRERVTILGVPVDKLTYETWLDYIAAWIAADDGLHHMCTVNPEFVMIAQQDLNFYNILNRADLCLADGVGLLYAARYLGDVLPERVTGSDGVPAIAERAAQEGWRLYLLGAWEGVAERTANVLRERYPGVNIVGTYSGSPRPEDEDEIVARVNAANADVLFVAYGAPVQDKWIARNAPRLNVRVAMGVGGTYDYIAGDVPLAPGWMRRAGLEWLFRLVRQPWRTRRQLRLPAFVLSVLWWKHRPIRHR